MEAADVLALDAVTATEELWGVQVDGTSLPVESYAWLDNGIPHIRLYCQASPVSGSMIVISFDGAVTMAVERKVAINKPLVVTIRWIDQPAVAA